jgi:hypothetical protein
MAHKSISPLDAEAYQLAYIRRPEGIVVALSEPLGERSTSSI